MANGPLVGGPVPAHREGLEQRLHLAAHVKKAGALRRAEPLVAVAGVEVSTEAGELERDLPGRVRSVDDREHPGVSCPRAQLLDGKAKRRRRGDVADEQRTCSRRESTEQVADRCGRRRVDLDVAGIPPLARVAPEQVVAAVLVRRRNDLVTRLQVQRAGDGVYGRRRVRHENHVGGRDADVRSEPLARSSDQLRKAALQTQELDRFALQRALEALVLLEHGTWARSVRAVVEEDDVRVE